MRSGIVVVCIALDTELNESRDECIKVAVKGVERLVALETISTLEVCIDNPHFHVVSLN